MKKKPDKAQKTEALLKKAGAKLKEQTKKLAEKQLLADEETYLTLFNKAADSIYLIDPKTERIIDCNPKASETTGYTLKQLKDKKMNELFPQEEQIIVSSILNKLNEAGELSGIAGIHLLKRSGELLPVEINATMVKLGGKKFSLGNFRDISVRNKVVEELKKSRERYQSLFQYMFIGCALHKIILDKNNRPVDYEFLQVNDAFVKLTGLKRADVIGKRVTAVIPGIEKSEFDWIGKYGKIAMEGGNLQFEQYSGPLKKWFSVSAFKPMENHFIAMFEDITERKNIEERIIHSKEEWEKTFDTIPDMVMISDKEFRIRNVNKALAERLGIKRKNLIGKSCYAVIHGTDKPPPFCPHSKAARTGKEHIEEIYEDKLKGHFILSCSPLYDPEGRPDGVVEVARDISERVQAEAALRNSELKYRNLVDNSLVGVFKSSVKGEILYVNEAMARMFEYASPEELMSVSVPLHYKNPEDRDAFIKQLGKKGKVKNYELEVLTKAGKSRHILLNATLEGEIISGMTMDITDRKELEEKLQTAAITDDLTGLFNRRGFITLAGQQCKLADRNKSDVCLLYLDLNGLKAINDELGHKAGDKALIDISTVLRNSFREADIIGRIGGDEFAVLLTDSSITGTENIIVSHLRSNLNEFNKRKNRKYKLSVSAGVAHFEPGRKCTIDNLLIRADKLMYEDKNGRHQNGRILKSKRHKPEKRAHDRFDADDGFAADLGIAGTVRIKNISSSGICLKTSNPLTLNKLMRINKISVNTEKFSAQARVAWTSPISSVSGKGKPLYESGLEFVGLSRSEKQSLKSIITSLTV
jgi:diguanylate cyclase (GGDEF)-like protein/PAS domain S-box-containing protein